MEACIDKVAASAYTIPTDALEGDGKFDWQDTTLAPAMISAGDEVCVGYSYTPMPRRQD